MAANRALTESVQIKNCVAQKKPRLLFSVHLWWPNWPVNQGGVSGIAGIVLPLDAVDQFSVQTQASPESGRNHGGTVDLALKSSGNSIHVKAYAYFRNESFAAAYPFITGKKENRNYNYGFSVGGLVLRDGLFYFLTFDAK